MRTLPMPTLCPVQGCGGRLNVHSLVCTHCRTEIRGEFQPNEFALLPPEHLEFLRLYIKVRGNLKEVERVLGLSYPTVRARFEALLRVLGYEYQEEPSPEEKEAILSALEQGQISAAEAAERLRSLKKR
ncbi:DUF2089 domain-containing protein [Meiothermus rufus]|uniref:DUF2089 domain-containing protein n=1 Tax=Meiothermus rufus TaxID=604332 RepID=UPI0004883155|nr:DUF2089 domain-containing protein [Meiothermus rufus]